MSSTRISKRQMTHSLSFDGVATTDDVTITNSAGEVHDNISDATYIVRFMNKSFPATRYLFSIPATSGNNRRYLTTATNGRWSMLIGNTTVTSSNYVLEINREYELAVAVDYTNSLFHVYIDGVLVSGDNAWTPGTGNANISIGNVSASGTSGHDGRISLTRIFDKVLTAQEVSDHYYNNSVPSDLIAEYFNSIEVDGAGTVLTDSVGSNDGTITGALWSTEVPISQPVAKVQETHALSFDGVDDYVTGSLLSATIDSEQSWDCYFMWANNSQWGTLWANNQSSSDRSGVSVKGTAAAGSRYASWGHYNGSSYVRSATTDVEIEVGRWYRLSGTYDGVTMKLYLDGVLQSSTAQNPTLNSPSEFVIGINTNLSGNPFDGNIASFRFWDRVLTAQEVYNLHHNNTVPQDSLALEYFNSITTDGDGTTLTDSVGSNDGTITGATWETLPQTAGIPKTIPQVLSFSSATTDDVAIENTAGEVHDNISDMSVSVKFKARSFTTSRYLFAIDASAGDNRRYIICNALGAWRVDAGASADNKISSDGTLELNREYEITVAWDVTNSLFHVYIDGVLDSGNNAWTVGTGNDDIAIGNRSDVATGGFDGTISDVRMFNRVLTAQEILDLHKYNSVPATGLIASWDTISDDGTTLIDSVAGNNGTISGAVRALPSAKPRKSIVPYVGSLRLGDTSEVIDMGTPASLALGDVDQTFHCVYRAHELADLGWLFSSRNDTVGSISYYHNGNKVDTYIGTTIQNVFQNIYTDSDWHWFTAVHDQSAGTITQYVNGVFVGQDSTLTGSFDTTVGKTIGKRTGSTASLDTDIASARLYNRALTATEVENLYLYNSTPYDDDSTTCVLNLQAKTDVLAGSTWRDVSGNDNHGTMTGTISRRLAPTKERTDPTNLVYNGNFEIAPYLVAAHTGTAGTWIDGTASGGADNETSGWAVVTGTQGIAQFDSTEYHSGTHSLKITSDGANSFLIGSQPSSTLADSKLYSMRVGASTKYKVSFWAKVSSYSGTSGFILYASQRDSAGSSLADTAINTSLSATSDWTYYETEFTTTSTTVFIWLKLELQSTVAMVINVDDIRLEKV